MIVLPIHHCEGKEYKQNQASIVPYKYILRYIGWAKKWANEKFAMN
jgi:hypothetical protein